MTDKASSPPPPANEIHAFDSGLRCPHCQYNLTGLTSDRCPECGSTIDLEWLRRMCLGLPDPIPIWDDPTANARFLRTCLRIWFQPTVFASSFPVCFRPHSARRFAWTARLTAIAVFVLGTFVSMFSGDPWDYAWMFVAAVVPGALVGSIVCEALLLGAFNLLVTPRVLIRTIPTFKGSSSWSGYIRFHACFLIIKAFLVGGIAVGLGGMMTWYPSHITQETLLALTVLGAIAWWWWCLMLGAARRSRSTLGRAAAFLLVPVITVISIVFGVRCERRVRPVHVVALPLIRSMRRRTAPSASGRRRLDPLNDAVRSAIFIRST